MKLKKRLRNTIALSGTVLALAIAAPSFAQYGPGYDGPGYYGGPGQAGWGAYDRYHTWRGARWWHQNNPDFFYANHPNWISWQPSWYNTDGAYDAQHNWHYGQWWYNQNPAWVQTNHPNWISQHSNWATHSEPNDHRAVMRTENEGGARGRAVEALNQPNRANEAAAVNQRNEANRNE